MYNTKIYVRTIAILEICCDKMFQIPVYNDQSSWVPNTTTLNIKTIICFLGNNWNDLHLNMYAKVEGTERTLTWANTIEYDFKSFQIITNILNCTDVQIKGLKILTAHRRDVDISNKYVMQI